MPHRQGDPLRELTEPERQELIRISRSQAAPAIEVVRAKLLLAVASGDDYQTATRSVGRRSGDAVSHLVARFNAEGVAALTPRHGGGRRPTYGPEARARIVAGSNRAPTPESDGTASWSLSTLHRSLRETPDGLPRVSTYTIREVIHEAGASYQRSRLGARPAPPCAVARPARRSSPTRMRMRKKLIEDAYHFGEAMGLPVWCRDQAGPYQTISYPGQSWQPEGEPARADR